MCCHRRDQAEAPLALMSEGGAAGQLATPLALDDGPVVLLDLPKGGRQAADEATGLAEGRTDKIDAEARLQLQVGASDVGTHATLVSSAGCVTDDMHTQQEGSSNAALCKIVANECKYNHAKCCL